jgi:hypothetical protein
MVSVSMTADTPSSGRVAVADGAVRTTGATRRGRPAPGRAGCPQPGRASAHHRGQRRHITGGPISGGRAIRWRRLPDDVRNGEAIHGLNPVRQVHL